MHVRSDIEMQMLYEMPKAALLFKRKKWHKMARKILKTDD